MANIYYVAAGAFICSGPCLLHVIPQVWHGEEAIGDDVFERSGVSKLDWG